MPCEGFRGRAKRRQHLNCVSKDEVKPTRSGERRQSAECVVGRDVGGGAQNKKKLMLGQGLPTEKGLSNEAGILIS